MKTYVITKNNRSFTDFVNTRELDDYDYVYVCDSTRIEGMHPPLSLIILDDWKERKDFGDIRAALIRITY